MDLVRRFIHEDDGQNVIEYALVLTLVAVVAIGGLSLAGQNINSWWEAIGTYVGTLTSTIPTGP